MIECKYYFTHTARIDLLIIFYLLKKRIQKYYKRWDYFLKLISKEKPITVEYTLNKVTKVVN